MKPEYTTKAGSKIARNRQRSVSPATSKRMKKLATTAAAVARRSCARMSHIRGVKVESRIIVPDVAAQDRRPSTAPNAINTGLWPHALPRPPGDGTPQTPHSGRHGQCGEVGAL